MQRSTAPTPPSETGAWCGFGVAETDVSPDLPTFLKHCAPGRAVPVCVEVDADTETPVSAFLKLSQGESHAYLFASGLRAPLEDVRPGPLAQPPQLSPRTERGAFEAASSSPETLVKLEQGEVSLRPIAGTRRRGGTPAEDARLEAELLADPKENAEHAMLVDLGRNDVGRVCEPGTVRVTALKTVERYSHVLHMVSDVRGRLQEGRAGK
jgi:chorismate binding enzyme